MSVPGSPHRHLLVGPVHGIASLKRHHPSPVPLRKFLPELSRRVAQFGKILVRWQLNSFQYPAHVPGIGLA